LIEGECINKEVKMTWKQRLEKITSLPAEQEHKHEVGKAYMWRLAAETGRPQK